MHKLIFAAIAVLLWSAPLRAEVPVFKLVIRNHQFEPAQITVPAGQKIRLMVENLDGTAEEFESYELNREKVVPPNSTVSVFVGPLAAGRYPFFGDFHQDLAKGHLIAE